MQYDGGGNGSKIVLIELAKSPADVNQKLLWETLYKVGILLPLLEHIRNGRQNTRLRCKELAAIGEPVSNNVGVFQGAALSAPLFIIYLEDAMMGNQSLNEKGRLQRRKNTAGFKNA